MLVHHDDLAFVVIGSNFFRIGPIDEDFLDVPVGLGVFDEVFEFDGCSGPEFFLVKGVYDFDGAFFAVGSGNVNDFGDFFERHLFFFTSVVCCLCRDQ